MAPGRRSSDTRRRPAGCPVGARRFPVVGPPVPVLHSHRQDCKVTLALLPAHWRPSCRLVNAREQSARMTTTTRSRAQRPGRAPAGGKCVCWVCLTDGTGRSLATSTSTRHSGGHFAAACWTGGRAAFRPCRGSGTSGSKASALPRGKPETTTALLTTFVRASPSPCLLKAPADSMGEDC